MVNKRRAIAVILLVVFALVVSACIDFDVIDDTLSIFACRTNLESKDFSSNDFELKGFEVSDDKLIATKDNPSIVIHNINQYADNLHLEYKESSSQLIIVCYINENINSRENTSGNCYIRHDDNVGLFNMDSHLDAVELYFHNMSKGSYVRDVRLVVNEKVGITFWMKRFIQLVRYHLHHAFWERFKIYLLFFFIIYMLLFEREFTFRYRWVVGLIILTILVSNKYNGDSLGVFNKLMQLSNETQYSQPILGVPRNIRSDDFRNLSSTYLSTQFLDNPYGKYNNIIRGTETLNKYYNTWYSFYNPFSIITIVINSILGIEYGYSFKWYSVLIYTFLINFELFYILTKKRKLVSLCSTCMICLSSFYLWWAFPPCVTALPGALVCLWYYFRSEKINVKILYAIGGVASVCYYILFDLYPAWQVPFGYLGIILLIWMIIENRNKLKLFGKKDYIILLSSLIITGITVIAYIMDNTDYINSIMNTVYPGGRRIYGGYDAGKLFDYIPAVFYSYFDVGNPTQYVGVISLFPLPIIVAAYILIKRKTNDLLLKLLLIIDAVFLIYCICGLPKVVANITLLSFSKPQMVCDVIGVSQVIIFARIFGIWKKEDRLPARISTAFSVIFVVVSLYFANRTLQGYLNIIQLIIIGTLLLLISFYWMARTNKCEDKTVCYVILLVCFVTGAFVRPICKGLDSIYEKPASKKIIEITSKDDGKWIASDSNMAAFCVASGAPTINFVNTYPNMYLWNLLDLKGQYNDVYNRFAYINVSLTNDDTRMILLNADSFQLTMSYSDLAKADVKYYLTQVPISNIIGSYELIYDEDGIYIYKFN